MLLRCDCQPEPAGDLINTKTLNQLGLLTGSPLLATLITLSAPKMSSGSAELVWVHDQPFTFYLRAVS